MRLYESLYLVKPDLAEEEYGQIREKFQKLISRNGGVLVKEDVWGKRELAYPVQKYMQGYYVLLNYAGMPGISAKLEREFRLDERVMKYHTIKLSERYISEGEEEQKMEVLAASVEETSSEEKGE